MKAFQTMDSWLIDAVLQPFCNLIEMHSGWNNYAMVRVLCLLFAHPVVQYVNLGDYLLAMMTGILSVGFIAITFLNETESKKATANYMRYASIYVLLRLVTLVSLALSVLGLVAYAYTGQLGEVLLQVVYGQSQVTISALLIPLIAYLFACAPLPPGWKRTVLEKKKQLTSSST